MIKRNSNISKTLFADAIPKELKFISPELDSQILLDAVVIDDALIIEDNTTDK